MRAASLWLAPLLLVPTLLAAGEPPPVRFDVNDAQLDEYVVEQRAKRLQALQNRVAKLTAQPGNEEAALQAVQPQLAYLIQTAPRGADRFRALQLLTIAQWLAELETADRDQARRLLEMPVPFNWQWPIDSLRTDLRNAHDALLARQDPLRRAQQFAYASDRLPRAADMALCLRGQAFRQVLRQRLKTEQTPIADLSLRWAMRTYLELLPKVTAQRVAPLDQQYAAKLEQARTFALQEDKQTARAAFEAAARLRPLRSLAFLQRIVSELDWGEAITLDTQSPDGERSAPLLMALAALDIDDPEVAIARATIVLKAQAPSPSDLDNSIRLLSEALAAAPPDRDSLRQTIHRLRAQLNARLGRTDAALGDQAAASDTYAALLKAIRQNNPFAVTAAFEQMSQNNEWRIQDLQDGVNSPRDAVEALRVLHIPGLAGLKRLPPACHTILANLRTYQKKAMVRLPGGAFRMGSNGDRNEKPEHDVVLRPFWMARTEVTVGEYELFLAEQKAGHFSPLGRLAPGASGFLPAQWDEQLQDKAKPVRGVSFAAAASYALWQVLQLPTEAQWEFAARGGEHRAFPCSKDAEVARKLLRQRLADAAAETLDKTPQGILHLTANVAEWCRDTFDPAFYLRAPREDPFNAAPGDVKVVRGGSFASGKLFDFRSARRRGVTASEPAPDVGIRLVIEE